MNATRLVAALAAVAVGFGITLVGVAVADDPTPNEPVTDGAPTTTPPRIEPVPDDTAIAETGAPDPAEPAPTTTDAVPVDSARSQAPRDEPTPTEPGQGENTTPVRSDPTANASGSSSVAFPCSDDAFDALTADLSDLEATELSAQTDLFLLVIAKELAALGDRTADEWSAALEASFDSFAISGCAPQAEQIFVGGSTSQFFCAAASVSADDRLTDFFATVVPVRMTACSTQRPQGEN